MNKFVKYYEEDRIYFPKDWNHYPSKIGARIGQSQLNKYDDIVKQKINKSKKWMTLLQNEDVFFQPEINGCTFSHCTGLVDNRNKWVVEYNSKGYQIGMLIEYSIPYLKAYKKYKRGEYPVSLIYSNKSLNFPNW